MKRNFKKSLGILVLLAFFLTAFKNDPSCNEDALLNKFAPALEDFVFITKFKIHSEKEGDKTNYSYVLSRGTNYKIVICDENTSGNKMIVNFLDRNKKLVATNYLKANKKFFPSISFSCQVTGVYYVEAYFEGDKKGCGLNILGFKKG
ncbi:MAG: hypothetical protein K0S32_1380 [Bacteroidetes bacterium]|jgi:hypothetical protein|nr:hypothetical protein [Bacteroidota bacterium]